MLADADGMRELGQPGADARRRGLPSGFRAADQRARLRIVPLAQLGGELEQPGEAVGALEAWRAPAPAGTSTSAAMLLGREALRPGPPRAAAAKGASGKLRARRASSQWPWTAECQS